MNSKGSSNQEMYHMIAFDRVAMKTLKHILKYLNLSIYRCQFVYIQNYVYSGFSCDNQWSLKKERKKD